MLSQVGRFKKQFGDSFQKFQKKRKTRTRSKNVHKFEDEEEFNLISGLVFGFFSIMLLIITFTTLFYSGADAFRFAKTLHFDKALVDSSNFLVKKTDSGVQNYNINQNNVEITDSKNEDDKIGEASISSFENIYVLEECESVLVGGDCCPHTSTQGLDLVLLIDSSSSVPAWDFRDFSRQLALDVTNYPQNTRLGVLQYSTITATPVKFDTPRNLWSKKLKNMKLLAGATWTLRGFQESLEKFFKFDENNNQKRIILITDGKPSSNQSPCSQVEIYKQMKIEIKVIGISDEVTGVDCLGKMEWLENWEPPNLNNKLLEMSLENINGKKSCPTDVTPYDGIYKLTSKKEHTLPIYISEQQWKLHFFDGQNWKFSDPDDVLNDLEQQKKGVEFLMSGFDLKYNPRICCRDT